MRSDAERTAIVRAYFEAGESARIIAERFGCSRSAVLGLVHRHRKKRHLAAQKRNAQPPRKRVRCKLVTRTVATSDGVRLVELETGACRFAVTPHHVDRDGHRFCGADTGGDGPYCAQHARLIHA